MAETTIQPRYLTYAEAERYTGIERTSLWRSIKRGELRVCKVGRSVRFDRFELDRFMAAHAQDRTA